MSTISRDELARRIAQDIPVGSVVNLGIGAPTMIANYLPEERHVVFAHRKWDARHGAPKLTASTSTRTLINAGKNPRHRVTRCVVFQPRRILRDDARGALGCLCTGSLRSLGQW